MPIAHFAHGVASGDPRPTSVVIWTRVTPTSASRPGSGAGPTCRVRWQVSTNSGFTAIVRSGQVTHRPRAGPHGQDRRHRPQAGAHLLLPVRLRGRTEAGSAGRGRHPPRRRRPPTSGSASCRAPTCRQAGSAPTGTWPTATTCTRSCTSATTSTSTRPGEYGYGQGERDIRPHEPAREMVSLADYRRRHAQYKRDPDLQRLHARYAFIHTWDDHESANDAWKGGAENHTPDEGELVRPARRQPQVVRRVDARPHERHGGDRRRHPALPPAPVRRPGRDQHARPAHLPGQAAGRAGRPRSRPTPPVPSPGGPRWTGSRPRSSGRRCSGSWSATR